MGKIGWSFLSGTVGIVIGLVIGIAGGGALGVLGGEEVGVCSAAELIAAENAISAEKLDHLVSEAILKAMGLKFSEGPNSLADCQRLLSG